MKLSKPLALLSASLVGALFSLSTSASQYEFIATDSSLETQTCIAAATGDLRNYRNKVSQFSSQRNDNMMQKVIVNKLKCNDMNIVQFASTYGAYDTAKYMNRFLKKQVTIRRDLALEQNPQSGKIIVMVSAK